MKLFFPLTIWTLNQGYGNDPVAASDSWYGATLVRAGQHIYEVLAGQKGHNGTDLGAPRGEPIKAIYDGSIIEQTARDTGFGLRITQRFEADGLSWLVVYGHMLNLQNPVTFPYDWNSKDHPVKAGDVIGFVDSTGASTGDHLHLGLYPMNLDGTKFLENNGYGGAIDAWPYLKGTHMVYFAHKAGTEEYGFIEVTPYTEVYHRGTNESDIKFMAAKFGLNILKADGTIDFGSAKEINI